MTPFLIRLALYTGPLVIIMMVIFLNEGGFSDPFYLRLTSSKQGALIIGTSRAAQGLVPSIINQRLKGYYEHPIYNYAFTAANSSYGSVYLESIKNKLAVNTNKGLFVVTVDPWSLSVIPRDLNDDDLNDEDLFRENGNFLAKIKDVSCNPNFQYLLDFYPQPFFQIILNRFRRGHLRLHKDGWLEVSIRMDSVSLQKRTKSKLKQYDLNAARFRFSEQRLYYLEETIGMLQKHGDVFLVRLPVHKEMLKIENSMMNGFTDRIHTLEEKYNVPYLDMTTLPGDYRFTDGNHLHKSSAKRVSNEIAQWIVESRKDI